MTLNLKQLRNFVADADVNYISLLFCFQRRLMQRWILFSVFCISVFCFQHRLMQSWVPIYLFVLRESWLEAGFNHSIQRYKIQKIQEKECKYKDARSNWTAKRSHLLCLQHLACLIYVWLVQCFLWQWDTNTKTSVNWIPNADNNGIVDAYKSFHLERLEDCYFLCI